MWLYKWLTVAVPLCLLFKPGPVASSMSLQQEYEWVYYGKLPQYAQDTAFSLVSFTIPPLTVQAQFHVLLMDFPAEQDGRKVLFSLRRAAIPVLQAFNETLPKDYFLPTDQQTFQTYNQTNVTLTLNSPVPGRVYLVATVLNPIADVVEFLQWHQKMEGEMEMSVTANYSIRTSVASLEVDDISKINSADGLTQIYSFRLPGFTMSYSVNISNCRQDNSSISHCPVTVVVSDSLAEDDASSVSTDCRQQRSPCQLSVPSPTLEQDLYITFVFNTSTGQNHTTMFDVGVHVQGCEAADGVIEHTVSFDGMNLVRYSQEYPTVMHGFYKAEAWTTPITPSAYRRLTGIGQLENPLCVNHGFLGRRSYSSKTTSFSFEAQFGTWSSEGKIIPHFDVSVPDFITEVRTFSLQESLDSGGDLFLIAKLQNATWQGLVWVCAMPHRLALNGSVHTCADGALLTLNATDGGEGRVSSEAFLHFPTSGTWYLTMQSQCRGATPCETLPVVQLSVSLDQCAPNFCGTYGYCQVYTDANLVFAGCNCYAGYRGLLCNDDTYSLTDSEQLVAVYLLTLSNLAFIPAICLALYRRYFILAAIFFFNSFFSTFYHACDTSQVFQNCIMDYDTLSFCDFFGSILSFYAVLLFMARVPDSCRSFLLVAGALVIAVFQNSLRHSDAAHIAPLAVAGIIMIASWIVVMRKRKQLFPSKRRYLLFLLPGLLLAVTGIGVNYGLMWHQASYQYTHSFWHLSLMLAPCFLMPPRVEGASSNRRCLSISAQDIIRGRDQPAEQLLQQQEEDEPMMFDASMNSINGGQNMLI